MTRARVLIAVVVGLAVLSVVGGAGVFGVCTLTSVECYYLVYGDPLEPTSGKVVLRHGFSMETVASGLELPTSFAFLPNGSILVAEKAGVVKLFHGGRVAAEPILDLRARVNSALYRGLVVVAVDPDFSSNGFVYVAYTGKRANASEQASTHVVVSRFVLRGGSARRKSAARRRRRPCGDVRRASADS